MNFRLSPSCQFFFHYEVTRIARVYKHAATNDNSLDLDPFNRKLALVGIIPIKFSSLSAPTSLIRLSVLLSLSVLKEKRIWLYSLLSEPPGRTGACSSGDVTRSAIFTMTSLHAMLPPQTSRTGSLAADSQRKQTLSEDGVETGTIDFLWNQHTNLFPYCFPLTFATLKLNNCLRLCTQLGTESFFVILTRPRNTEKRQCFFLQDFAAKRIISLNILLLRSPQLQFSPFSLTRRKKWQLDSSSDPAVSSPSLSMKRERIWDDDEAL